MWLKVFKYLNTNANFTFVFTTFNMAVADLVKFAVAFLIFFIGLAQV